MLSRTADSLYWLSRSIERAEFVARILEAARRLSSLPSAYHGRETEWEGALLSAADYTLFRKHHDVLTEETVSYFLSFSPYNPSSIASCLEIARTNARSVRTALTVEMWEAINGAWLELKKYCSMEMDADGYARFFDWVKTVSLQFDGSAYRTMLRNDAYWFTRLGVAIERADNTARILDVKYNVLLPEGENVGGSLDYFQWTTILREVSALTAYHWVYKESIKPWLVADLLLLNPQMPRSLASCAESLVRHLDLIAESYERRGPSQRLGHALLDKLNAASIESVFASGLHEFIQECLGDINALGQAMTGQYLT
jgi:uncharacterized alpha-E superfamily protein